MPKVDFRNSFPSGSSAMSASSSSPYSIPKTNFITKSKSKDTKTQGKQFVSFIQKLSDMVNDDNLQAIGWNDCGDAIKITDTSYLCSRVFPEYFKHDCWASFTRQLNMYGFTRDGCYSSNEQILYFKHPQFLKDRPDLISQIKRRVVNANTINHNQSNQIMKESNYENSEIITGLQKRMAQMEHEMALLRRSNYQLHQEKCSFNSVISHNRSTMVYVRDVLSRSVQNSNSGPELGIAFQAIQSSLSYQPPVNEGNSQSPQLSSESQSSLDHVNHTLKTNPNNRSNIRLPPISSLCD